MCENEILVCTLNDKPDLCRWFQWNWDSVSYFLALSTKSNNHRLSDRASDKVSRFNVFSFWDLLWYGNFYVLPPVFTKWYRIMIDIMKLMLLTQTPSAYSAPGTPPANRTSFVGVTPRDPGGLYQAQVSLLHLTLSGEDSVGGLRNFKTFRKHINTHLLIVVSTNANSWGRCFYKRIQYIHQWDFCQYVRVE